MSTRGCIARSTGEGTFTGVYHHWDSYPDGLGATLIKLYNGHFNRDLEAMLTFLIDQHPAGWSTINNANFFKPAGFRNPSTFSNTETDDLPGPICYCHGERSEKANPINQDTDAGMEWAYVFDVEQRILHVLERVYKDDEPEVAGKHMTGMFGIGAEGHQRWKEASRIELEPAAKPARKRAKKQQAVSQ